MRTRQSQRKNLSLPGRYFTGVGSPADVIITDLSVGGCRFPTESAKLQLGANVQIAIDGSAPLHAQIAWVSKGEVGVTFAKPLTEAEVSGFKNSHVARPKAGVAGEFENMEVGQPRRFC